MYLFFIHSIFFSYYISIFIAILLLSSIVFSSILFFKE